ncbi:3-isopropylmalate dehydratase small subunit [Salinarimonas soli]|uniref:3-isopropylmalate dehydratase n=1 Tax=Salinarimonas soli TaxID=1638099 RepID=A0A5B2VC21_9HYPH|nr:3-isopropylmalate dehydratase small subunit [Salinarimonas soli]KAA2236010.1 3-isopropylmalate dehydratase small subunit [Salinarimonas soli]
MEPLRRLDRAVACPLPLANVDTDQIIPARFMKQPRQAGYGGFLLHDLRFGPDGAALGLSLDDPARAGAGVLVARRNFGGGSSREAAVYALVDFGVRCVVAPSFGDIFASNAVNNGLLPAVVSEADAERLIAALEGGLDRLSVDLEACRIEGLPEPVSFSVDPVWRTKLLNGWDDLDLTLSHADAIRAWAEADAERRRWARPSSSC